MCGIVYSRNFRGTDVNGTVLKRFEAQRSRGTTSFGFYDTEHNQITTAIEEKDIKRLLKRREHGDVLFHHRFSTSTPDVRNACHPFSTKNYFNNQYIGVHNGVISNPAVLENQHKERGIKYVSRQADNKFNDSEALIYDIARYLEGEVDTLTASGTIAFIITRRNAWGKATGIFFGRNSGNPLKMKKTEYSLTISSEGEGEDVPIDKLHYFDFETKQIIITDLVIPRGYSYSKNHYGTYNWDKEYSTYRKQAEPTISTKIRKRTNKSSDEIAIEILKEYNYDYIEAANRAYEEWVFFEDKITNMTAKLNNIKKSKKNKLMRQKIRQNLDKLIKYSNLIEEASNLISLEGDEYEQLLLEEYSE